MYVCVYGVIYIYYQVNNHNPTNTLVSTQGLYKYEVISAYKLNISFINNKKSRVKEKVKTVLISLSLSLLPTHKIT